MELMLETVFSTGSVQSDYKEANWGYIVTCRLIVEFCNGGCGDRTWAREAEESPLLEAVARERLVKTQQAGERLSEYCGDLRSVEISDSAVITCSYEWSINQFTNPSTVTPPNRHNILDGMIV
jgi:hypothetical protein